jgi:hypothetical protein
MGAPGYHQRLRRVRGLVIIVGDLLGEALDRQSLALVSLRAGRPDQARDLLSGTFDCVASSGNAPFNANILELSAAITAELGDPLRAARP